MNCRGIAVIFVVLFTAGAGFWGCSKKEAVPTSATVSVAFQETGKELPRLEQNYLYEKGAETVEQEPFYYHETENSLKPMSEEEKKKAPPPTV
ncbi:MAG: hypothetical protein HZC17_06990 [Candidatus Omnitrophica bacterium]|nr:hypothetical protein [Candidatus Omnitrophota bacterium]